MNSQWEFFLKYYRPKNISRSKLIDRILMSFHCRFEGGQEALRKKNQHIFSRKRKRRKGRLTDYVFMFYKIKRKFYV